MTRILFCVTLKTQNLIIFQLPHVMKCFIPPKSQQFVNNLQKSIVLFNILGQETKQENLKAQTPLS